MAQRNECVSKGLLYKNFLAIDDVDALRRLAQALAGQVEDAVLNRLCCLNINNAVGIDVGVSAIIKPYLQMVFKEYGIAVQCECLVPDDVALVTI